MTIPDFGPAERREAPADPVEFWLQRARCCGAPSLCGAICMDDERSQTEARVVRRLDDAEAAVARVGVYLGKLREGGTVGLIRAEVIDALETALGETR